MKKLVSSILLGSMILGTMSMSFAGEGKNLSYGKIKENSLAIVKDFGSKEIINIENVESVKLTDEEFKELIGKDTFAEIIGLGEVKKGDIVISEGIIISDGFEIGNLEEGKKYKFSGYMNSSNSNKNHQKFTEKSEENFNDLNKILEKYLK